MSKPDLSKLPRIGAGVMVWPSQRTLRDENKQPVLDENQQTKTVTARVRDHNGTLITAPIPAVVNAYYYKLLAQGNLDWCTKDVYQANLVATRQPEPEAAVGAIDQSPMSESPQPELPATNTRRKTTQAADDTTQ